jgi:hypothetical protein
VSVLPGNAVSDIGSLTFTSLDEAICERAPGTGGDTVDMVVGQFRPGSPGVRPSGPGALWFAAVGTGG